MLRACLSTSGPGWDPAIRLRRRDGARGYVENVSIGRRSRGYEGRDAKNRRRYLNFERQQASKGERPPRRFSALRRTLLRARSGGANSMNYDVRASYSGDGIHWIRGNGKSANSRRRLTALRFANHSQGANPRGSIMNRTPRFVRRRSGARGAISRPT